MAHCQTVSPLQYSLQINARLPYAVAVLGGGGATQADAVLLCAHGDPPLASSQRAACRTSRLELFAAGHRYRRLTYQPRDLEHG